MEDIKSQVGGYTDDPQHGYERTDIEVRGVLGFLALMVISAIIIYTGSFGFYRLLDYLAVKRDQSYARQNQNRMEHQQTIKAVGSGAGTPSMQAESTEETAQRLIATFPSPRLQTDDVYDMSVMHGRENLYLNNYTWVDRTNGVVRIPVDRAIDIIAERGLPNVPYSPAVAAMSTTAGVQPQQSAPGASTKMATAPPTPNAAAPKKK